MILQFYYNILVIQKRLSQNSVLLYDAFYYFHEVHFVLSQFLQPKLGFQVKLRLVIYSMSIL